MTLPSTQARLAPVSPEEELARRRLAEGATLTELRRVLGDTLAGCGLAADLVPEQFDAFRLARDPYDGGLTLVAEWRDARARLRGSALIHESGHVFAELDVCAPAPRDPAQFIDAVVAFGTRTQLSAELRLLPSLE